MLDDDVTLYITVYIMNYRKHYSVRNQMISKLNKYCLLLQHNSVLAEHARQKHHCSLIG